MRRLNSKMLHMRRGSEQDAVDNLPASFAYSLKRANHSRYVARDEALRD